MLAETVHSVVDTLNQVGKGCSPGHKPYDVLTYVHAPASMLMSSLSNAGSSWLKETRRAHALTVPRHSKELLSCLHMY